MSALDWTQLSAEIERELNDSPDTFLRQHWISKTMHPAPRGLSLSYWKELVRSDYFIERLLPAAIDSPFGRPHEFEHLPRLSPQSIQHAYYLNMLHDLGVHVEDKSSIVEIGGGYGNFARICRRLGFKGTYTIMDLPVIHRLQKTFLDRALPGHGVEFVRELPAGGDLLIATFSVSEFPPKEREALEPKYAAFDALFFGLTESFCGIPNPPYFEGLAHRIGGKFFKDKHRNAWFVTCVR